MPKAIKNPYVAHYNKWFKNNGGPWVVSKRWVCADKVRFDFMCSTTSEGAARLIARALNAYEKKEIKDEPQNIDLHPAPSRTVPVGKQSPKQGSFDFMQGGGSSV